MKMKVDEIALCADAGAQLDLNVARLQSLKNTAKMAWAKTDTDEYA